MLAITNAKVLTITRGTIERGTVLVDAGKIVALGGPELPVPDGSEVIDATGRNFNMIFFVAPFFFVLAILCMLGVTRGEAKASE